MPNTRTYGSYRTGGLWAAAGISFGAVIVGSAVALFGMLEFDERCQQGLVTGPGALRHVRNQPFPPATVCEFERGDVTSVGGGLVLGGLLWLSMLVLVICLFAALIAEWFEPRLGGPWVTPISRTAKLRRTGTAFFVTGSAFLMFYALAGWKLLAGPASACSTGADWGTNPPRTLQYSFLPPQATCQYTSGMTRRMNPDWVASLATELAVPALVAGVGFALAWWRWRSDRSDDSGREGGSGREGSPGRADAPRTGSPLT
ncbi:hypothetical protein PV396_21520 [Streptomyces sp. ME02-8801-2C]|uniref:hypothetical protein n=1 Tax=Streptomyces sp. ME02-8801-2C TaxID=3028680 RepID=UPI0029BEB688|nr:hypothetical protein [Streptomyces sp. ME02-8801-2C]MDX3454493.1 hypothetical protein [Streptomyces sp. ME02-8801-2C]